MTVRGLPVFDRLAGAAGVVDHERGGAPSTFGNTGES